MNRYSAQKQYWKAKQTKQDKEKIADVVLLQKLQVSRSEVPSSAEQSRGARLGDDIHTSALQIRGCSAAWLEARTWPVFCCPRAALLLSSVVSRRTALPSPRTISASPFL